MVIKARIERCRRRVKSFFHTFFMRLFMLVVMCVGFYHTGHYLYSKGNKFVHTYILRDNRIAYNYSWRLNQHYAFFDNGPHGVIADVGKGRIIVKDVSWVSSFKDEDDSLLCFASKGYRGFFNINTGKVDIAADRYKKAWVFAEGMAGVMTKDSTILFLNPEGKVVLDKKFRYNPVAAAAGYVFNKGLCPMNDYQGHVGLIDKNGIWSLLPIYDSVWYDDSGLWIVRKNGLRGVVNMEKEITVEPQYLEVKIGEHGIEVLRPDFTRQLLDFEGNILQDFTYTEIEELFYKTKVNSMADEDFEFAISPYKAYHTTYPSPEMAHVGLLGPDGRPVTPPLYTAIEALGNNCFRCYCDNSAYHPEGEGLSVVINSKGEIIK